MQVMIQMLHLKIVNYFIHVRQMLMMFLLMKQIIFILQCLCTKMYLIEYSNDISGTYIRKIDGDSRDSKRDSSLKEIELQPIIQLIILNYLNIKQLL